MFGRNKPEKQSGLGDKFKELEEAKPTQVEKVDTGFGKKDYYLQEQEQVELGKSGLYNKGGKGKIKFELPKINPLLIAGILLVIIGVAGFLFFYKPTQVVAGGFEIVVFAGEAKLPNAVVTVYDGEIAIANATTDSSGRVSFSGLPNKILKFEVSTSSGKVNKSINTRGRKAYSFNVGGAGIIAVDELVFSILQEGTREPIEGVKISYSLGSEVARRFVDSASDGKAVIPLEGESIVRLRIVDPQRRFQPESFSILASKAPREILLKPLERSATQANVEPLTTSVIVKPRFESAVVPNAIVTASYVFTGGEINSVAATNGEARFENLSINSLISFTVQAPSFYPKSNQVQLTKEMQPIVISLNKIPPEAPRTKIVANVGSGEVYIFQKGNLTKLVSTVLVNGSAQFVLEEGAYYALVIAQGYLPFTTSEFTNGEQVNVELLQSSEENSVNLEVNVTDEDGASLSGASAVVLNADGLLASLPIETQLDAPVTFVLPVNLQAEARAVFEGIEASQVVDLFQDASVQLQLSTKAAFLDLQVRSLKDNSLVSVTLTSFYNGAAYNSCSGNGGCTVRVKGNEDIAVQVEGAGYLPYTFYSESIPERTAKSDVVHVVPSSLANAVDVKLLEVKNSESNVVTGNVLRPGKYNARFFVSGINAEQLSLYVRIGDGKQNSSLSAVHLLEPLSVNDVDVAKSKVYLGEKPQCEDLLDPAMEPPYKWVELTFFNTSTQEVDIPFEIPQNIRGNSTFTLEYRGKIVAGNAVSRFPQDSVLGFEPASLTRANCYAETTGQRFTISESQAPSIESVLPLVEGQFTSSDGIVFDPVQGKIKSQNGLTAFELQVDSILPGDAMPLALQSDDQCSILVKQPNTTSNDPTASCYRYDSAKSMLVFETKELNSICPIYLKNDKFYSKNGARVLRSNATLSILATCSPEAKMEMPITVKFVSDVVSLTVKPESDQLGEGDAAKLLYVINNRQLQRRNIEATFQSTKNYQLSGVSAKAIAWRGPGDLEFSENGDLIEQITFEGTPNNFLKTGIGILSHRQTTCGASDVYCCANGWCTRKALEEFIPSFKEIALKTAKATAFRRGSGQPLAYFSSTPFKFVTVVQAAQGSQTALTVQGTTFSQPVTCLPGNPGVYELTASSLDNGDDSWNYSARALELKSGDYIQAPSGCGGGSNVTQFSATAPNGEVTLCNFLQPKNNCIESTKNASIVSIDQVETLTFEFTNCMYPVFPGAPVCPGIKMVLPAVNIGNLESEAEFNPADAPNAFEKIWEGFSDRSNSNFSIFSWSGQLKCIVPPSVQQFAITAAASGINLMPGAADEEAKTRTAAPVTADVCKQSDFFNLGVIPNMDTLIPLAGVCCPEGITAQICTPKRGKFFVSSRDNKVKIITQWGLTEGCYPYWPFPTTIKGLMQSQNLVSAAFGLGEFITSNGANFEMSLSSETPGEKPVAAAGLSSKACRGDGECAAYEQCAVNSIYSYKGSGAGGSGKCVGASSTPGVCTYSNVKEKEKCTGGMQCETSGDKTATCKECGNANEASCCVSDTNAYCKGHLGCFQTGTVFKCTSNCGDEEQPPCADTMCNSGLRPTSPTFTGDTGSSKCVK
ncbi:MAG: hypothetical protein V1722_01620 [Candidatus Micrarchaeota archaeon]